MMDLIISFSWKGCFECALFIIYETSAMKTTEMPMGKRIILSSGQHLNSVSILDQNLWGGNRSFSQNWLLNDAENLWGKKVSLWSSNQGLEHRCISIREAKKVVTISRDRGVSWYLQFSAWLYSSVYYLTHKMKFLFLSEPWAHWWP